MAKQKDKANGAADPSGLRAAGKMLADAEKKAKAAVKQLGFSTRDKIEAHEERELPVPLSPAELAHQGAVNAATQGEIDAITADMARKAEDFKAEKKADKAALKKLQDEHKEGSAKVRDLAHVRLVPVRIEHDFGLGSSRFYRLDRSGETGGELYDTTPMDPDFREKLRKEAPIVAPTGGQEEAP